jgi:hypothetical protein
MPTPLLIWKMISSSTVVAGSYLVLIQMTETIGASYTRRFAPGVDQV